MSEDTVLSRIQLAEAAAAAAAAPPAPEQPAPEPAPQQNFTPTGRKSRASKEKPAA